MWFYMELFIHHNPTREEVRAVASGVPQLREDGKTMDDFNPDMEKGLWLKGEVGGEVVAFCHFIPKTSVVAEIHPAVLKPFRREYAREFTGACLNIGLRHWDKILAVTPTCERTTINYAVKHGFKFEGIIQNAWRKNGKLWHLVQLSYER